MTVGSKYLEKCLTDEQSARLALLMPEIEILQRSLERKYFFLDGSFPVRDAVHDGIVIGALQTVVNFRPLGSTFDEEEFRRFAKRCMALRVKDQIREYTKTNRVNALHQYSLDEMTSDEEGNRINWHLLEAPAGETPSIEMDYLLETVRPYVSERELRILRLKTQGFNYREIGRIISKESGSYRSHDAVRKEAWVLRRRLTKEGVLEKLCELWGMSQVA